MSYTRGSLQRNTTTTSSEGATSLTTWQLQGSVCQSQTQTLLSNSKVVEFVEISASSTDPPMSITHEQCASERRPLLHQTSIDRRCSRSLFVNRWMCEKRAKPGKTWCKSHGHLRLHGPPKDGHVYRRKQAKVNISSLLVSIQYYCRAVPQLICRASSSQWQLNGGRPWRF